MRATIHVLLSTYNGAKYLPELLDSLVNQTFKDWLCLIRDDGSTDETLDILQTYIQRYPSKFELIDDREHLGVIGSFERLMRVALSRGAEYIAFCDQDDVWLPEKLELQLRAMRELERRYGREGALLVHTDLTIVDESLRKIADSFWRYTFLNPQQGGDISYVILRNVATGCATMVNRHLVEIALPIPEEAVMHDWWLLLVAAALGKVSHVDSSTILYRQHGANAWGAVRWSFKGVLNKALTAKVRLRKAREQARAFLDRYGDALPEDKRSLLQEFARLDERSFLGKRLFLIRRNMLRYDLLRNLGILLFV